MTNFLSNIDFIIDYYNSFQKYKNKDIENWFLLKSPIPTIVLAVVYLILVTTILPKYMRKRKEYELKWTILLYNLFAFILNIYIIYKVIKIKYLKNDFNLCSAIKAGDKNDKASIEITSITWWFYISKLIEFLDTIFFILRKKFDKLTALHIYHHSTMFLIWWIGVNYSADGYTAIATLFNSFVHGVMYFYYILSALGYKSQRWCKRYLTLIQMLQFCILITISSLLLRQNCEYKISDRIIWFGIYYSLSHLIIFFYSYITSYYNQKIDNTKTPTSTTKVEHAKKLEHTNEENFESQDEKSNDTNFDDSMFEKSEFKFGVSKRRPLRSP